MTTRPLHPAAPTSDGAWPPPRHQAPGGWRRALTGLVLGGLFGLLSTRWLRPGPPRPLDPT